VNFAAFVVNFQRVSQKAFPQRKDEIEHNIAVIQVFVQLLTFAQFGALFYTILREHWRLRHEHGKKLVELKRDQGKKLNDMRRRASTFGTRLRSRSQERSRSHSSAGGRQSGSEKGGCVEMTTVNVNTDSALVVGSFNAEMTSDQVAASEGVTPWRFSAAATSQVVPSESSEGGAVVSDGEGGEEKYWAANPIVEHQGRTGSVGV
jgi:hypothetical protein